MYERVNVNCARENSTGDWESGIHNFIFQNAKTSKKSLLSRKIYDIVLPRDILLKFLVSPISEEARDQKEEKHEQV